MLMIPSQTMIKRKVTIMSKYTTQVRWIVENFTKEHTDKNLHERVRLSLPKIFNFSFPIYDESHRNELEEKIINHYLFREIGLETVALWQYFMSTKLNEIMPYYNKLYESSSHEYDYLTDYNMEEITIGEQSGTVNSEGKQSSETSGGSSSNDTSSNSIEHLYSDLPGAVRSQDIGSDYYANAINKDNSEISNESTSATNASSNGKSENTTKQNGNSSSYTHRRGNLGKTPTQLIQEYRASIINIDMQIVNELSQLFMTIY